jgi:biopolymer transport protein ExbB
MSFIPDIGTLVAYFNMGGFVMLPLLLVSVLLWYALAYRAAAVSGNHRNPRQMLQKGKKEKGLDKLGRSGSITARAAHFALQTAQKDSSHRQIKSLINEHFRNIRLELSRYKLLVRSLVGVAPLLGLLGTVDGMIETFDSLGDMALFSATGGIAGGISKALFTTQMGLAVSIPGLLFGRMIERRERQISRELDQIRDLVCAER